MNDVLMQHQWIKVIIPVRDVPLFCAFCQLCHHTFTEQVGTSRNQSEYAVNPNTFNSYESTTKLPKWGCTPIEP